MELWIILLAANQILGATCPFTSNPIGVILGWLNVIAVPVFIVLTFIFSASWWYGLIALAIYGGISLVIPKIDASQCGKAMWVYSMIGSHIKPIITIFMYLDLFNVI